MSDSLDIPKNNGKTLTNNFNNYVLNLRQHKCWVPDAAEYIFLKLVNRNKKTQQLLKKEFCNILGISAPTLTRSLEIMEKGSFIKITCKKRMGTIITINNLH